MCRKYAHVWTGHVNARLWVLLFVRSYFTEAITQENADYRNLNTLILTLLCDMLSEQ